MTSDDLKNQNVDVARPPVEKLEFTPDSHSVSREVLKESVSLLNDLKHTTDWSFLKKLFGALFAILILSMVSQVLLTEWQGGFYRAIERKNVSEVWHEVLHFVEIIALLLTVVVCQVWLLERFKIRLRQGLASRLIDEWLRPGRAYRLAIGSDDAANPDQRMHEDIRNLSEMTGDLGVGLIQSCLSLISFIGILWHMSDRVKFDYHHQLIVIPGYMVWIALLYSALGSWLTAWVGRPLVFLNEQRYGREANLRFALVRTSESSECVALSSGESNERNHIKNALDQVIDVLRMISFAHARLTWVTSGYGWMMLVVPVLVALPGFLHGSLDLGGLMVVVASFNQVQQALRWFIDNYARIADWRAALHRVAVFRNAIHNVDTYEDSEDLIEILDDPNGRLVFDHLKISLVDGPVVIAEATAEIFPGERVLIEGESGSGKSTLFRVVAGLWPWGSGKVYLPNRNQMMFLPQRPYIPLGTLADAAAYPLPRSNFSRADFERAFTLVNLPDFIPLLETQQRWDKLMSLGQQQRLAFARILLHKPKWIFLDEATSALDDGNQDTCMSLFTTHLKDSAVLSIAHRSGLAAYHTRGLQLVSTTEGTILKRRPKHSRRSSQWWRNVTRINPF